MNFQDRYQKLAAEFSERFGYEPLLWSRAPGRVDLMGSHTDYNQGYVLTMSIDRDTWIAARPRSDHRVAIASMDVKGDALFSLNAIDEDFKVPWTNYARGVAWALQEAGYSLVGFDGLVQSTIPFGSGLSSSAALEMATAEMFRQSSDLDLGPVKMALLGQKAENQFVGVNSGILDQYSSTMGQADSAILLDCQQLTSSIAPISDDISVVICDTRAHRSLTGSEYGERRAQCERGVEILAERELGITALRDVSVSTLALYEADLPEVVARRCRFIVEENQRVLDMAAALSAGDFSAIRGLTDSSFAGARDLYEIVVPEMEAMIQAMLNSPGVIGARQAGAGFGGCMVACVNAGQVDAFTASVTDRYKAATGIHPFGYSVRASAGAGPLI